MKHYFMGELFVELTAVLEAESITEYHWDILWTLALV